MQYSSILLAAVAAGVANAVAFTNSAFNGITAGQPIDLTWGNATGPVTITLKNGASTDLQTVSTITSGQTGTSFTWNVPATLASDTYALEISDSAGPNYSPQFELIGGSASSSSAASSSSTASASSSASSSSDSSSVSSITLITSVSSSTASSANTTTTAESTSATSASNSTTTGGSSSGASSTGASPTGSQTSSGASPTGSSSGVPNSNSGAGSLASPLALVFLTFAAIFSLN
ncbi:Ser-Thr-rich glycosyl-phosphatidyl-inositol-anchored membrane family-domain-containing protein [Amylocarpus encephaloides]|uniref:Ser-Thr-rich glycosyl-phosphatidyl-inositol-anchored membrane family-domain-containing protein n=1 Tax=Amylocarpus encephaloides TaxID=45428 RepID=A0A9P7YDG2_9HELO|nr:Ser-Thr-rich glycosyl-phosphatidyl-inositol-anchored membrane family-domain-containing protein [Amylocarpus encephaloides]